MRAGKEGTSVILEIWGRHTIDKELHIPTKLHGSVFNDGWFSNGASWSSDELRIAYVAEVCRYLSPTSEINNSKYACPTISMPF